MNEMKFEVIRFNSEDVIATSGAHGFAPTAGPSTYYTSTINEWNQAYADGKVDYDVSSNDVLLLMTFTDQSTVNSMVQFAENQPFPNGRPYAWYNAGYWWTEEQVFSTYGGNLPD